MTRIQPRAARSNSVATAAFGVTTNPLVSRLAIAGVSGPISDVSSVVTTRGGLSRRSPTKQVEGGSQGQHGGQHERASRRFCHDGEEHDAGGHGRHLATVLTPAI